METLTRSLVRDTVEFLDLRYLPQRAELGSSKLGLGTFKYHIPEFRHGDSSHHFTIPVHGFKWGIK